MIAQTVVDRVFAELKATHDEISTVVIDGGCESWDAYTAMVGEMRGLRAATDVFRETLKKFQESEDEA